MRKTTKSSRTGSPASRGIDRRDAVKRLLAERDGALVVAGLGAPAWDCAAAGETDDTFYLWGGMGLAASIGLGLALAQPKRRIVVVTGDGEAMMGLGGLAVVAAEKPNNFAILVLDNEAFGETGHQPGLSAAGIDLAATALGLGFRTAMTVATQDTLGAVADLLFRKPGPNLVVLKIRPGEAAKVLPERDGAILARRFRSALAGNAKKA